MSHAFLDALGPAIVDAGIRQRVIGAHVCCEADRQQQLRGGHSPRAGGDAVSALHPWEIRTAARKGRTVQRMTTVGTTVVEVVHPFLHQDGTLLTLVSWSAEDNAWIAVLWDQERRVAIADGQSIPDALAALAGAVYTMVTR
jgi:hypothetical protein